jgi:hypothetical protein
MLSVLRLYSVVDRTIHKYGAVGRMKIGGGNQSTWRKSTPVPNFPSKIPSEKPEPNRLSCGTALLSLIRLCSCIQILV